MKFILLSLFGVSLLAQNNTLNTNVLNHYEIKKGVFVDLTKAIKIGEGNKIVVEFGDPECPACRMSEKILKQKDITRYVFLSPLSIHKLGQRLSIHSMCFKNPSEEFEKAISGQLDTSPLMYCNTGKMKVIDMLNISKKLKLESVPTFYIDGKSYIGLTKEANQAMKIK